MSIKLCMLDNWSFETSHLLLLHACRLHSEILFPSPVALLDAWCQFLFKTSRQSASFNDRRARVDVAQISDKKAKTSLIRFCRTGTWSVQDNLWSLLNWTAQIWKRRYLFKVWKLLRDKIGHACLPHRPLTLTSIHKPDQGCNCRIYQGRAGKLQMTLLPIEEALYVSRFTHGKVYHYVIQIHRTKTHKVHILSSSWQEVICHKRPRSCFEMNPTLLRLDAFVIPVVNVVLSSCTAFLLLTLVSFAQIVQKILTRWVLRWHRLMPMDGLDSLDLR